MKVICLFITTLFIFFNSNAQQVKVLTSGTKTSLRGLSVVSDKIVWASGSNGIVAKSIDAGITWKWITVKGFEKNDFRDIEAFDENTAIIMAVDSPAYILKTIDGGTTWKTVYENHTKGMFLDAMDFYDDKNGVVIGDPIDNVFFIAYTHDSGNTWIKKNTLPIPTAKNGEACFASSGTNIKMFSPTKELFITGGLFSRFALNNVFDYLWNTLPIIQGKESIGANSIDIKNKKMMVVVGGDFSLKDDTTKNCFYTNDAGKTWYAPQNPPSGYRSCVLFYKKKTWLTCGLNGIDISKDNGHTFTKISNENFHACKKAKHGKSVFFAGNNGKVGIFLKKE